MRGAGWWDEYITHAVCNAGLELLCGWLRGTAVERRSGQQTSPGLRSTCSRPSDVHYRSTNQANSTFHPFGVDKWIVCCNWMSATSVSGGAIWWTLTKERQVWCNLYTHCYFKKTAVLSHPLLTGVMAVRSAWLWNKPMAMKVMLTVKVICNDFFGC